MQQTAGRGRRGHTWFSPPAAGLVCLGGPGAGARTRRSASAPTLLTTLAAGVALAEGVEAATGLRADHQVAERPATSRAGSSPGSSPKALRRRIVVVLGYGINVHAAAFPPDLADRATSLESELGREVDRAAVLVETLAALARRYDDLLAGRFDAILDAWRAARPPRRARACRGRSARAS